MQSLGKIRPDTNVFKNKFHKRVKGEYVTRVETILSHPILSLQIY